MYRERVITQDAFDRLLAWLDADRERAAHRYESIRRRLIEIFTCRGCAEAEELTDETIDRVILKVEQLAGTYVGDPALYFYGVANRVRLEYLRRKPAAQLDLPEHVAAPAPESSDEAEESEREYECFESCLRALPPGSREMLVQYFEGDGRAKIDGRRELARRLSIAQNALRIRIYRLRATLQECVEWCLRGAGGGPGDEIDARAPH